MAISIKLSQRSYGGKKFRPTTRTYHEDSNNLLICVTAWGKAEIADQVAEFIKTFIASSYEDREMTVPYAQKENLHHMGNVLRMSVIMASEKIFNQYNKDEYRAGFEVFAAVSEGPQWVYVSCGQPSLVLSRPGLGLLPLTQAIDMNVIIPKNPITDPMPNQLLGLGQHPPIQYGNLLLKPTDKLALISRTHLPTPFFQLDHQDFAVDPISKLLAADSAQTPFWLGILTIN